MLRPATPLAVILLLAFALLLVSVISTPVVKSIKLATFNGVDFGVLGYCQGTQCSGPSVGYSSLVFTGPQGNSFSLPSNTRHSLSSLLIVHVVAAFLTLVLLVLAGTAHLHAPSHSPRYLLALLILTLPTLLISLLAFLVDILLFVPHMQFGSWLVLAATILIAASGVLTCAMRRTLVSRKARKKRIAENAEMNGENFYANQSAPRSPPPLSAQPTAPMVNGAPGADKLPQFATFDLSSKGGSRASNDERVPLNPSNPSMRSKDGGITQGVEMAVIDGDPRNQNRSGSAPPNRTRANTGGRDEFGNPLPPSSAFGPGQGPWREPSDPRLRNDPYGRSTSAGPPPFRGPGRGGYSSPSGRGRGGPPGGWRGGPPPPMPYNGYSDSRGQSPAGSGPGGPGMPMGAMMTGGRGGPQRGPPPGYGNGNRGGAAMRGGGYGREQSPYSDGARRPSPGPPSAPGYGRRASPGPPSNPDGRRPSPGPPSAPGYGRRPSGPDAPEYGAYGARQQSPHSNAERAELSRADSPPPLLPIQPNTGAPAVMFGQAVEMDATTGSPSPSVNVPAPYNQPREDDDDVPGMVGLQQNRQGSPMRHDSQAMTTSSVYSNNGEYVPPRSGWAPARRQGTPPLNAIPLGPDPVRAAPAELPARGPTQSPRGHPSNHARGPSSDTYYEDVDPRFAEPQQMDPPNNRPALPSNLQPGYDPNQASSQQHLHPLDERHPSYEDLHDNSRSPAESDISNYTSISQRGVNPNWHPGMAGGGGPDGNPGQRRQMPRPSRERDMLFAGNNDFEIPGGRGQMGRSRGQRMPGQIPPMAGAAASGGGRYPGPNEL